MDRGGFDRRLAQRAARLAVIVMGGAWGAAAWAQVAAPGEVASAPSERAKRDAERPFQWILLHSDKPRKARDSAGAAAPAAPAVARPARATVAAPTKAVTPSAPEVAAVPATAPTPEGPAPTPPLHSDIAAIPPSPGAAPQAAPAAEAEPDDELEVLQQVAPSFPRAVMLDMRKGTVQVRFKVRPDGSVVEPTVLRSSHPRLNAAAVAAVVQWKFKPLQGQHEAAVELGFNLDN